MNRIVASIILIIIGSVVCVASVVCMLCSVFNERHMYSDYSSVIVIALFAGCAVVCVGLREIVNKEK